VTLIIPPSVDVRTLSRYAGLSSDDSLCAPMPRFHRLENMLTLGIDASDEFRSLNVWLEQTVSSFEPSSPLIPRVFVFPFVPLAVLLLSPCSLEA
jgi:hypothetical protein